MTIRSGASLYSVNLWPSQRAQRYLDLGRPDWTQLTLSTRRPSRYVSSMNDDPLGGGLVLFGGELSGDIVTNQTWLFVPVPVH